MPYELEHRLVIGVASSALFDLTDSHADFLAEGEDGFRAYQELHLSMPLKPGGAFQFNKRVTGRLGGRRPPSVHRTSLASRPGPVARTGRRTDGRP